MVDRPAFFRECREALGLTQAALGDALWVGMRAVRYWEAGDREVPGPAWVALISMLERASKNTLARRAYALKDSR